ncbi:MAG: type I-E CRISPR-associated protein Cas5/CasD, partial [Pirellulaceae bacterium]
ARRYQSQSGGPAHFGRCQGGSGRMTSTLLIPLVGPLQAWGVDARFDLRQTGREPSKSGVLGLCCAALGRDRTESIEDLAGLLFGVRVDSDGHLSRDFHTAENVIGAGETKLRTVVSDRWYLAHAAFLAGFEGPAALLNTIHTALQHPHWALSLGRKSCPPSIPPGSGGVIALPLQEALLGHPPLLAAL